MGSVGDGSHGWMIDCIESKINSHSKAAAAAAAAAAASQQQQQQQQHQEQAQAQGQQQGGQQQQPAWSADLLAAVTDFFDSASSRLLIIYQNNDGLTFSKTVSTNTASALFYFLKESDFAIRDIDTFKHRVQFGYINQNMLNSLSTVMTDIFCPLFSKATTWPKSVRNDFAASLNKFMSSLTDALQQDDTLLYIPVEDLAADVPTLAQSKELILRLETAMIHWTRQLKDSLNISIQKQNAELPLEEISNWKKRCTNLESINQQLNSAALLKIVDILKAAKSPYVAQFATWATLIQDGTKKAESNVQFLSLLSEPCLALAKADLAAIPTGLPKILDIVRVIWINSPYYNSGEQITFLLQKVCCCCCAPVLLLLSVVARVFAHCFLHPCLCLLSRSLSLSLSPSVSLSPLYLSPFSLSLSLSLHFGSLLSDQPRYHYAMLRRDLDRRNPGR